MKNYSPVKTICRVEELRNIFGVGSLISYVGVWRYESPKYIWVCKIYIITTCFALFMNLTAFAAPLDQFCGGVYYGVDKADAWSINLLGSGACSQLGSQKNKRAILIPVKLSGISFEEPIELVLDHRKASPPGFMPPFVLRQGKRNDYTFDWSRYLDAYNDWPRYQRYAQIMHADGRSRRSLVKFYQQKHHVDELVICEISYVDDLGVVEWKEMFFNFDGADGVSVWLWSPLMANNIAGQFESLEKLKDLFFSLRTASRQAK